MVGMWMLGNGLHGFQPLPSKFLWTGYLILSMNFSHHKVGIMREVILHGSVLEKVCCMWSAAARSRKDFIFLFCHPQNLIWLRTCANFLRVSFTFQSTILLYVIQKHKAGYFHFLVLVPSLTWVSFAEIELRQDTGHTLSRNNMPALPA